jgi:hypothetical protein
MILDLPEAVATVDAARTWIEAVAPALGSANGSYAAAYWPDPIVPDPLAAGATRPMGPSGLVAGVYAATDIARGVWTAAAGIETSLADVVDLSVRLTDAENGLLNPLGLDALRIFPAYGAVVWDARTLQGADPLASEWKYVPVRRLALFIEQSVVRGLEWISLEPDSEALWSAIRLQAGKFMNDLFRDGAFPGPTPNEAYYVRCDTTTTSPANIEAGIVNLLIGFAPLKPGEFVILKIQLQAAAAGPG